MDLQLILVEKINLQETLRSELSKREDKKRERRKRFTLPHRLVQYGACTYLFQTPIQLKL